MSSNIRIELTRMILTKIRPMICTLGCCGLLFSIAMQTTQAADFDPVDLNKASLQSRKFEQVRVDDLVNACFSVIQDINFHVLKVASAPIVIVAYGRGRGGYTLTINIHKVSEDTDDYQVRLTLNGRFPSSFYQNFFNHLNKTYFVERAIQ